MTANPKPELGTCQFGSNSAKRPHPKEPSCVNWQPASPQERTPGHSALRVKNGKIEKFDLHSSASAGGRDIDKAFKEFLKLCQMNEFDTDADIMWKAFRAGWEATR